VEWGFVCSRKHEKVSNVTSWNQPNCYRTKHQSTGFSTVGCDVLYPDVSRPNYSFLPLMMMMMMIDRRLIFQISGKFHNDSVIGSTSKYNLEDVCCGSVIEYVAFTWTYVLVLRVNSLL
jgi:hypothetical protein